MRSPIASVPRVLALATTLLTSLVTTPASADRLSEYATADRYEVTLPGDDQFAIVTVFPTSTTEVVDGYRLAGRLLAVVGEYLYIQKNTGSDLWLPVAKTPSVTDPTFLAISPDGHTIAVGVGWGDPMVIVASADLSVRSPIDLATWPAAKSFDANYYEAAWLDNRYLLVNEGWFSGSQVYAIDTAAPDPGLTFVPIIENIPGASSGLAIDAHGNVATGNGYGANNDTGEIRIFAAADIAQAIATGEGIEYVDAPIVANNVLSANNLGFDAEGNLTVAGGDAFGGSGDLGYTAVIGARVFERVLADGAPPVDEDDPLDYQKVIPPVCPSGSWSRIQYIAGTDMLLTSCGYGESTLDTFIPSTAPDSDGDGIPDGVDNAQWYPNPDQADLNGDGIGDAGDIDFDGDGIVSAGDFSAFVNAFQSATGEATYDARLDFDVDGAVDWDDYRTFLARWSYAPPY